MPYAVYLLAEEIISGGGIAGWTSFGLAGLILGWLFLKHLPDKDKQLKDLIERKDDQLKELLAHHRASMGGKDDQIKELLSQHRVSLGEKDVQIQQMLQAKNEQIKILTVSGTEQVKLMVQSNNDQMKLMHQDNRQSLDRIIAHCESETKESQAILRHDLGLLTEEMKELNDSIKSLGRNTHLPRASRRGINPEGPEPPA